MAPVAAALRELSIPFKICVTAQHREMLDQVLEIFGLVPDFDLNVMTPGQTLTKLTVRLLEALGAILDEVKPATVLVQGDTTSAFVGALAAFYRQIPVGHVEAGLRTWDLFSPWPEEANRQLVGRLAQWHFAPTDTAKANLLREGTPADRILVVGNTVIDALLATVGRLESPQPLPIPQRFDHLGIQRPLVLVTAHRRESFGEPMRQICRAIATLATEDHVDVLFPVHPNPSVREATREILEGVANVHLVQPLDYVSFVAAMRRAHLILSDSGGVQEEAPSLGKPVLVLRELTERVEAVEAGTVRLVGTETSKILSAARQLLGDAHQYADMANRSNPYGDGTSGAQIARFIGSQLGIAGE